jgi:hypothetical protein
MLAMSVIAPAASKSQVDPQFLQWFDGEFDNRQQVSDQDSLSVAPELRHAVAHFSLVRFRLEGTQLHASYVEQYRDSDPERIAYQRIWLHHYDASQDEIVSSIHELPQDKNYRRVDLPSLSFAQLKALPTGCAIRWKKMTHEFRGRQSPELCQRTIGEQQLRFGDTLLLSQTEFWTNTDIRDLAGNKIFGNRAAVPLQLRRVPSK